MEVLIASTLVAIMTIGLAQVVSSGQAATYDALHQARGTALAEVMLEEILARPYEDPDGTDGETDRADLDDIDDYDGYSEGFGQVRNVGDVIYPQPYDVFRRDTVVAPDTQTISPAAPDVPGLRITVTVTDERGAKWSLERFVPQP